MSWSGQPEAVLPITTVGKREWMVVWATMVAAEMRSKGVHVDLEVKHLLGDQLWTAEDPRLF